ncbi:MAG: hypothetical protein ACYC5Z_09045, partial [Acidimicrobiales bacterium]
MALVKVRNGPLGGIADRAMRDAREDRSGCDMPINLVASRLFARCQDSFLDQFDHTMETRNLRR